MEDIIAEFSKLSLSEDDLNKFKINSIIDNMNEINLNSPDANDVDKLIEIFSGLQLDPNKPIVYKFLEFIKILRSKRPCHVYTKWHTGNPTVCY